MTSRAEKSTVHALPAIWHDRDGFMNAVSAIQGATSDLVEATGSGDAAAVGTALTAAQDTRRGCHTDFRGPGE